MAPAGASVPGQSFTQTQCEAYSDAVARLYTAALDREPEQGGFDWWLEEYTQGRWTLPRMAQFFVESPEFQQKYGALDDRAYITQIYRNVLDREPDGEGLDFWAGQMTGGMSRAILLLRFSESPENITNSGTSQPALGEFNEGRSEGPWVCGPDLSRHLLDEGDLEPGWSILAAQDAEQGDETGCEAHDAVPAGSPARLSASPGYAELMAQTAYPFATTFGAERFLDEREALLDECASFTDRYGNRYETMRIDVGAVGDRVVAYRLRIPDDPENAYFVFVRVGRVVMGMAAGFGDERYPPTLATHLERGVDKLDGVVPG